LGDGALSAGKVVVSAGGAQTGTARSADFQVGCVADFQIREPRKAQRALDFVRAADLEIGDTAGLETCATGQCQVCPNEELLSNKIAFEQYFIEHG
jgi:hypothetical protein